MQFCCWWDRPNERNSSKLHISAGSQRCLVSALLDVFPDMGLAKAGDEAKGFHKVPMSFCDLLCKPIYWQNANWGSHAGPRFEQWGWWASGNVGSGGVGNCTLQDVVELPQEWMRKKSLDKENWSLVHSDGCVFKKEYIYIYLSILYTVSNVYLKNWDLPKIHWKKENRPKHIGWGFPFHAIHTHIAPAWKSWSRPALWGNNWEAQGPATRQQKQMMLFSVSYSSGEPDGNDEEQLGGLPLAQSCFDLVCASLCHFAASQHISTTRVWDK